MLAEFVYGRLFGFRLCFVGFVVFNSIISFRHNNIQKTFVEICGGDVVKRDLIIFENVTKYYDSHLHVNAGLKSYLVNLFKFNHKVDKKLVLSDISFQIKEGETVGFIGRNGAGKSTLLGLIAQVMRPTSGNVTVNARVSSLLELGAGFHPDLTGRENLELYGVVLGFTRAEVAKKAGSIIDYSDLGSDIDVPIRFYSSGMLARLGFSIIAHLDPEILLIDEVLAVGDHLFQEKCIKTMESFRRQGKTLIIVSHASSDIEKLCDRVFWIDQHKIEAVGLPRDIIKRYHGK